MIRALNEAFAAGEREGFQRGFTTAQTHRSQIDEVVHGLLQPKGA
jgi:hypothetical protein